MLGVPKLSQAEYLKKYLSKNGDDKKRKIKIKVKKTIKIIDDDIDDFKQWEDLAEDQIISSLMSQEDAPQIVMIDNRGPIDFNNKQRWKQIAADSIEESESQVQKKEIDIDSSTKVPKDSYSKRTRTDDNSDLSPSESKSKKRFEKGKTSKENNHKKRSNSSDSDMSPPRSNSKKDHEDSRTSQKRKSGEENYHKSRNHSDSDLSPPRSKDKKSYEDNRTSDKRSARDKRRRNSSDSDLSPPRFKKMKKTLDGTSAGLQNIKSLKEEEEAKKRRENEMMEKMSREMSGQSTVVRDRKTGRRRNLEREAEYHREKQQEQEEINAKYAQWGRGLKQSDDHMSKLQQDLKEMDKPLTRYADDEDLEKELKSRDRDDDPMLAQGKYQTYSGSFSPNRYDIKPGVRWDGVDRSNGYEKKWFEQQNKKKAVEEEAYKWSIADM
ncbi:unnamed protein product [Trichogramma brassicae]|uniref:BUD13 homolog n=1 Tax=Trichogramma brassicae TaxID=86971 RepID=A0A6H5J5V4_9HYME|nr:unnamed protein product [Trichogramma brassicae]